MPPQRTTGAEGISIGWLMRLRMLSAQSLNHVHATNIRKICGQGFDMRRFVAIALTAGAALGALLLALWLDATATPPVI